MSDKRTALWVLEYVLLQPIDDWAANAILAAFPVSAPLAPRLKKALLLRRLAADLSRRRPSERTLHSLELIEELDRATGSPEPSELMRLAYWAVAVECTARPLREGSADGGDFFDAVNRIWNCRVADLERSEAAGLVSMLLRDARKEMEEAVVNPGARIRVMGRDTKKEALGLIKAYLKWAGQEMGPSFLELLAESVIAKQKSLEPDRIIDNGLMGLVDKHEGGLLGKGKHEYHQLGCFASHFDHPPALDAVKVEEGYRSRCLCPPTVIEDPSPGTTTTEVGVSSFRAGESTANPEVEEDRYQRNVESVSSGGEGVWVIHGEDTVLGTGRTMYQEPMMQPSLATQNPFDVKVVQGNSKGIGVNAADCDTVAQPSIMDRNLTARAYEWDYDLIESPSEKSPNASKKLHLPSRKDSAPSPLQLPENKGSVKQKEKRKWSALEEETLRKAVAGHGKGNWKFIKMCHPTIFQDRTEVNLKDKWRNMIRQ